MRGSLATETVVVSFTPSTMHAIVPEASSPRVISMSSRHKVEQELASDADSETIHAVTAMASPVTLRCVIHANPLRLSRAHPFVVVLLGLGMTSALGCYPKAGPAPQPLTADSATSAAKRWPGETAEKLAGGHDLFVSHCNACHSYPDLTAIDDDHWPKIVESMGNKAQLNPDEKDAVLHFVLAWRASHTGP